MPTNPAITPEEIIRPSLATWVSSELKNNSGAIHFFCTSEEGSTCGATKYDIIDFFRLDK
jgi:hypothetical protein